MSRVLYSAYYTGADPFKIFDGVRTAMQPSDLSTDGVLILWGGEDISPSLYNQVPVRARAGVQPSMRDIIEKRLFERAVELGIPIIGVCRGAQLACALSGGTLFQHIAGGHHSEHLVETKDGHVFATSSCHHQALNLENVDHDLLAWDKDRTTVVYTDTDEREAVIPEVAIFNKTKTLAIQGHPEWMTPRDPFVRWLSSLLRERFA